MTADRSRQLAHRAGRSGLWVLGGRAAQSALRLVSSVVMAHLLFPDAFGLMGMVMLFLLAIELFSDTGLRPSIVRSKRGEDPDFLATAWTVQAFRGVFLFGVSWAFAAPYAAFYEKPELERLLPLAGIVAILNGLRSTNLFLADRRLAQARNVLIGLVANVLGMVTTIVWAWLDRSVDALIAGTIVAAAAHTLASHLWLPGPRSYFRMEKEALRELISFGKWIFLSTALAFASMQADKFYLGYVLLAGPLGIYFIAKRIVELVTDINAQVASSVAYPTWMESARKDPDKYVEKVQRSRRALNSIGMAGLLVIATLAPALFRNLYDDRYWEAALFCQILIVPAWFLLLKNSASNAILVYGDSRALMIANAFQLVVKLPACVIGYHLGGIPGIILGTAVGNCVGLLPIYYSARSHHCPLLGADVRESLRLLMLGSIGILLPHLFTRWPQLPLEVIELPVAAVIGLIALLPARQLLTSLRRRP